MTTSAATLTHPMIGLAAAAHPRAVRSLRADAVKHMAGWGLPAAVVDAAEVVVSELLTNALVHGLGHRADSDTSSKTLVLRIAIRDDVLRIEVDDPDADHWPCVRTVTDDESESGNGMLIVDRLARWGFICGVGKTVYAEITLPGGVR